MAGGGTRAIDELVRAGVPHVVHEYVPDSPGGAERGRRPAWGEAAAAALGIDPARIHKTLIATVDGRLAVAVVPVAADLDLKALATALGGRKAELAVPLAAERSSGYVRGGISPLGQRRRLPTVLDSTALDHPTIFVSAGRRGLQVELTPEDLAHLTGSILARLSRPRRLGACAPEPDPA